MRDLGQWRAKIYEDPATEIRKIYIMASTPQEMNGYVSNAHTGEIKYIPEGEAMESPSMQLTEGMMQALFEALQESGMKPKDQSYIEGKLEATQEHLKDMREIVFEKPVQITSRPIGE